MNNFNLGEVLTRAWQIIWKHKILWVFGVFAVFASGGGGGGGGGGSGYQTGSDEFPFSTNEMERWFEQFGRFIEQNLWIVFVFIAVVIILSLLFYALGIMGRIGLIKGVHKVENGAETLTFAELWSESMPYFWRVFGLNFLVGLALTLLFLAIFVPMVFVSIVTFGLGFLCLIPLLCVLIPLSWVVMVILEQAQVAIVIENLGMWDSFKRGWEVVRANAVNFILLALILFLGGAVIGIIIALPIIVAVIPLIAGARMLNETLMPVYLAAACCAIYIPVLYLLTGILTAYIQSVWALTFLRLTKPNEETPVFAEANP